MVTLVKFCEFSNVFPVALEKSVGYSAERKSLSSPALLKTSFSGTGALSYRFALRQSESTKAKITNNVPKKNIVKIK